MIESFVDLTYRGLPLGRRIKLTQVRPGSGYLELPAPMPVGTAISLATDEGVTIEAVVAEVREQVAGAEIVPGMKIVPALGGDKTASWWNARVALPAEEPKVAMVERAKPVTVRPRNATVPTDPPPEALMTKAGTDVAAALRQVVEAAAATPVVDRNQTVAMAAVPEPIDAPDSAPAPRGGNTKATTVMAAVDQELLAQLTKDTNIELFSGGGEVDQGLERKHAVVDDGQHTMVMQAMDPAALGLDVGESGAMRAATDDGEPGPDGDKPKSPRKRRTRKKV